MDGRFFAGAGALFMLLGVAFGAFGAHGLKDVLDAEMKAVFETGVRYQVYHALGLFAAAWVLEQYASRLAAYGGLCFIAGIVLFSGSLYGLSLSGLRRLGAITPLGGLLFLAGWLCLLAAPYKN